MTAPLGAVLAGGAARRMGGAKMTAGYAGRPLLVWPVDALRSVLDEVVVVAKRDTVLPPLEVPVWIEPDEPRHPLAGIVHALREAGDRAVLVCAGDMPAVDPVVVRKLAAAPPAAAVVPRAGARLQPLLARYEPSALEHLAAAAPSGAPLTEVVESLSPDVLEVADETSFRNVNTAQELAGGRGSNGGRRSGREDGPPGAKRGAAMRSGAQNQRLMWVSSPRTADGPRGGPFPPLRCPRFETPDDLGSGPRAHPNVNAYPEIPGATESSRRWRPARGRFTSSYRRWLRTVTTLVGTPSTDTRIARGRSPAELRTR